MWQILTPVQNAWETSSLYWIQEYKDNNKKNKITHTLERWLLLCKDTKILSVIISNHWTINKPCLYEWWVDLIGFNWQKNKPIILEMNLKSLLNLWEIEKWCFFIIIIFYLFIFFYVAACQSCNNLYYRGVSEDKLHSNFNVIIILCNFM